VSIDPEVLARRTLMSVSSSWHEYAGERSVNPVHVWITVSEIGTLQMHTLSGLVITQEPEGTPVDMQEYGRIVVEPRTPSALNQWVGQNIERVSRLRQTPPDVTVGMVLHFRHGSVGIADLGDELVAADWPAPDWALAGVALEDRD
jgi:hypothetical protein